MKLGEIKQKVFGLTGTENTKQLKKKRLNLTKGRDLRYKAQWLEILEKLEADTQVPDLSLGDLENSERMLRKSLLAVGHLTGLSDNQVEVDWQRIKLETQFGDIHIEEL